MDRATRNLFALLLVGVIALTGGAALILGGSPPADPGAPPGTTAVVGAIVGVQAESLGDVRSFQVRTTAGEVLDFDLSALENGDVFPPGHLAEHQVTAEPVRVWYRDEGGTRFAIRVDDAGP
ncbi:MAG: hypothetical protein ACSLFN_14430 [Candidatus Limnocylindrales bacterium]